MLPSPLGGKPAWEKPHQARESKGPSQPGRDLTSNWLGAARASPQDSAVAMARSMAHVRRRRGEGMHGHKVNVNSSSSKKPATKKKTAKKPAAKKA